MSLVLDLIGGAIGAFTAIATVAITYAGLTYTKKRNLEADVKTQKTVEIADAVALSNAINDISWIKEQLGKEPNGGGAMEQLLTHARNQDKVTASISDTVRTHLTWHVENGHK